MEKAVRRIGVFTSGGDAPGMNAAIRAVVRTSLHMGIECVGIRRGYHGLINGDFTKLTFESVSDLSRRGGTMLYSARSEEFKTPAGQERAVATCKMLGLDALVGIGGDGTFSGLLCLAKRGLSVVGIPGTIDNDIACSSYTIGYDTACNTALESIDNLLEPIRRARLAGRTHFMIIVAEGVEGGAYSIGKVIEEATALDTRVTVLGHIQRGGSPSSRDRITATYMGYEAVRLLAEGKTCRVVALQGENYVDYDITEALQMTKSLDQHTYEVMRALTGVH